MEAVSNKQALGQETLGHSDIQKVPRIIESWWGKGIAIFLFLLVIILMFNVNTSAEKTLHYYISAFGSLSFIYMMFRVVLSFFYRPVTKEPSKEFKVSVIIPSYNEEPESVLESVQGIVHQDYPIHEIIFVDDGSTDSSAYQKVKAYADIVNANHNPKLPRLIVHRFKKNRGKKEAQAWGFQKAEGDLLMLADSDGYIYPNAVRELVKPFEDDKVFSVVGHINAKNVNDNAITRMQDMLYQSAFRIGRAAQSVTNSVIVCSGALSMHRREIVVEHIDEFLQDKYFGINLTTGDDRKLTDIALKYGGKTKYQSTALCVTDVPIKSRTFFKQQVRWSKSFYLQTLNSMKHAWNKPFMMFWLLGEGLLWLVFVVSQAMSLVTFTPGYYINLFIFAVAYFILSAFIFGLYYFFKNPIVFIMAPIYSLIHMILLFPVRVYALLTINKSSWGTR